MSERRWVQVPHADAEPGDFLGNRGASEPWKGDIEITEIHRWADGAATARSNRGTGYYTLGAHTSNAAFRRVETLAERIDALPEHEREAFRLVLEAREAQLRGDCTSRPHLARIAAAIGVYAEDLVDGIDA